MLYCVCRGPQVLVLLWCFVVCLDGHMMMALDALPSHLVHQVLFRHVDHLSHVSCPLLVVAVQIDEGGGSQGGQVQTYGVKSASQAIRSPSRSLQVSTSSSSGSLKGTRDVHRNVLLWGWHASTCSEVD
jgi:hypothetical protein